MKNLKHEKLKQIIKGERATLEQISDFLSETINDNDLLTHVLRESEDKEPSFGQKLADKVAEFGGSWYFIVTFGLFIGLWITVNTAALLIKPFDVYPFILLNLILSCIAALQAPVIMMSQNRKEEKDRQRAEHDYLINLKAEMEIRNLQLNMKHLFDIQKQQIELLENIIREKG